MGLHTRRHCGVRGTVHLDELSGPERAHRRPTRWSPHWSIAASLVDGLHAVCRHALSRQLFAPTRKAMCCLGDALAAPGYRPPLPRALRCYQRRRDSQSIRMGPMPKAPTIVNVHTVTHASPVKSEPPLMASLRSSQMTTAQMHTKTIAMNIRYPDASGGRRPRRRRVLASLL